ncbi:FliH/SctL family protein [Cellulosimicrobium sp. NPDC057127]|uniref:FliH/SctL family protein n=1 Tax=Cellulosimicrobium sp. NPDC057127 TaxID=3346026 RepID=UPI0036422B0A
MSTDTRFVPQAVPVLPSARLQEVEASASARGYAAGYAAGARAAQQDAARARAELEAEHARRVAEQAARTERALAVLREAARALGERTVPVVAEAQDATVRGALDLAESIVGFQLADRSRAAQAALERVTASAEGAVVAVRLHPDDVDLLAETGVADALLVPDPALRRGDAVADLEHGFLDARVRTAVERARAALADPGTTGGGA